MSVAVASVAVVGGGPAGLAAAWRLAAAGRRVRLYEGRETPGGRLRTERLAGVGADAVVQLVSRGYSAYRALLGDLGLEGRLVEVPGHDALWRGGVAHGIRYGSVTRMAMSRALPARLKVRMGLRYVPYLERHGGVLDLNDLTGAAAAGLDTESIADWGRRELGEEFVELMVYPLLAAYYGVEPEETSAAVFHALAHAGQQVTVMGLRGGAGAVAEAMADALVARGVELATGAPVRAVEPDGGGVRVRTEAGSEEHAAAIVAVPASSAAGLVPAARWLSEVPSRSTAILVLALDRPLSTGWFGLSIPRREPPGERLAAVCVQAEKRTGVVPEGRDALVVVPAPGEGRRWAESEPRVAVERALPGLEQVLPGVGGRVAEARLVRLGDAVFVPVPGHFARVRSLDHAALPPRLALAGDYLVSPTVEGAVRSGRAAADRILAVEP